MGFKVLGTGSYVPERIVTNDELSQMVETSDEWIVQRVGVRERHVSVDETTADMGIRAAARALEAAGIKAEELGLIVTATCTGDSLCPSTAALIQRGIGASCPAFDVNSACSGFLFALETAAALMEKNHLKYVLVLGAEHLSRVIDWHDRSTCVIFGDGAGAAVLGEGQSNLASRLFTQGNDEVLSIPAGKSNSPFYTREETPYKVYMNGQETFKFAVRRMAEDLQLLCADAGLTTDDLSFIVPHQANTRIIDLTARRLKIPMEKFVLNIEKYGNTSSASVPISFDELVRSGKLKKGDKIAMCAFGGGLSSAGVILEW
ncbi:MAG: ketoacyl-ACP synthase III [Oscillospiraceae bacterium]|nr:ketoacyl-ACP synthase III [Oscillospiraceae bacterium]